MPTSIDQPPSKPISAKIAKRIRLSLVRYKNVRQPTVEQLPVEMIVGLLQAAVLDRGDRDRLIRFSFVRSTRSSTLGHASLPWLTIEGAAAAGAERLQRAAWGGGYRRSLVLKSTRVRYPQTAAGRQITEE